VVFSITSQSSYGKRAKGNDRKMASLIEKPTYHKTKETVKVIHMIKNKAEKLSN